MRLPGRPAPSPTHATESSSRGVALGHGFRPFAVAALACAALMGFSATAQAQTKVERNIWSAEMTVGVFTNPAATFSGFGTIVSGDALSDRTFTVGTTTYTVNRLTVNDYVSASTPDLVEFQVSHVGLGAIAAELFLYWGTTKFALSDDTVAGAANNFTFTLPDGFPAYSAGDTVAVRLARLLPPPSIASGAITSAPTTGDTYGAGETIQVTLTFNEAVKVTGTPNATLWFDGAWRGAAYTSGSGTTKLVFEYRVQTGDRDANGVTIGLNVLFEGAVPSMGVQGGGTIKSVADDVDASLASAGVENIAGHKVDGSQVTVTAPEAPTGLSAGLDGQHQLETPQ